MMKLRKTNRTKRRAAGFLAFLLAFSLIPASPMPSAGQAEAADGILAQLSFDDEANGFQGGGAKAVKNGSNITLETDAISGKSMRLTSTGSFLNLTKEDGSSLLTGKEEITISYFSKATKNNTSWSVFAAPNANTQTYQQEHYLGVMDQQTLTKVERFNNSGSRPPSVEHASISGQWRHVAIVVEEGKTTLYVNGTPKSVDSTIKLSAILGNNSVFQVGKGNWESGEYFNGYIDEMTIYDHALTGDQVTAISSTASLKMAKSNLISIMKCTGENNALTVKENMTLPTTGSNGTAIAWTSSDESLIKPDGTVIRPSSGASADGKVTLTATISLGDSKIEVTFEVTVMREQSDQTVVEWVKNELKLTQTENIKGNITLPTDNEYNATITWKSSNPAIISDTAVTNEGYDNKPAGVVTRGDAVQNVMLTATIQSGEVKDTKVFPITVAKKAEEKTLDSYLFTYFPSNSQEQIYFATGRDAFTFKDMNNGEPVLTSDIGDKGVRDPYIFRSAEGDHFYMIATDLKVQTTGWDKAQYDGSLNLVIWESDDLVNWSEPRLVDVGMTGYENVGCVWAPEAIYDELTGEYVVFWASMTGPKGGSNTHQIVYYSKTRDFVNFTVAKPYIDRGNKHCIDTSIIEAGGKYYRVSADGAITIETSDTVLGQWTTLSTLESLSAGMKGYKEFFDEMKIELKGGVLEGPELFKFNDSDRWGLYSDNYGGVGYIPVTTTDLSDTTGSKWEIYTKDKYNFGSMKKRHGSILGITQQEYEAVMKKWDKSVTENDEEEKQAPVLSYDFEEAQSGTVIADKSGNNYNGTLNGKAAYAQDTEKGKVLSLDGSSGTFAAFPEGFFDGRNKFTLSFDMKADTVSGNFFNFAIGKNSTKYMFLRTRDTDARLALTTNSYGEEEAATANFSGIKNKWVNFSVVVDRDRMYVYKDGVQIGMASGLKNRITDLGENLIAYLGKSFYSGDAYFKGFYDNIKVYNRARGELEIAKEHNVKLDALKGASAEGLSVIKNELDKEKGTLTLNVSKNNSKVDMTKVPLIFNLVETGTITGGTKATYDLTKDFTIETSLDGAKQTWTVKTVLCNNPVLGGQFADPDIDAFNGKYYIYPTTDGFSGWSGYQFHVFSSDDMVNWKDEGVILDLKANTDEEAGKNEQGVQIAPVPWSDGSAWAPTIEEKNGKYYFYFCGNDTASNSKAMGVAVADSPTGPFKVQSKPLVTKAMCSAAGVRMGQTIDPSIFTDDDGRSYMLFGNGNAAIVELNDDMVSIKEGTMKNISGATDLREAITVTKRNGVYHFTWSCDDTGSENYSVNYGTSDKLYGPITFRSKVLQKDPSNNMLGTGHHSILQVPGTEEYYIAYHRFVTPLGQFTSGFGFHRETCIDKVTFDETTGLMNKITPTLTGITEPVKMGTATEKVTVTYQAGEGGTVQGQKLQTIFKGNDTTAVTAVANKGYEFMQWSDGNTNATRNSTGVNESVTVTAEFARIPVPPVQKVTLTYKAMTGGTIQGTAVQTVEKGKDAKTVKAVAKTGYRFTQWSDGVKSATRTDKNVQSSKTLTARFEKIVVSVSKVKLDKTKLNLGMKETFQLKATVYPSKATVKTIKWKSSSAAVSVTSKGKVTAKKPGSAVITATANNGKKTTCKITVKAAPKSITLNAKAKSLKKGKSFQIKVKLPKNTYSNKITYTSSKKSVASVSATGKVKALKKGKAVITVKTFNGKKAGLKVTVK